jgi:hypothetical protein
VTADRRETAGVVLIVAGIALFALAYALAPAAYRGSNEEQFAACVEDFDREHIARPGRRVAGSERLIVARGNVVNEMPGTARVADLPD